MKALTFIGIEMLLIGIASGVFGMDLPSLLIGAGIGTAVVGIIIKEKK